MSDGNILATFKLRVTSVGPSYDNLAAVRDQRGQFTRMSVSMESVMGDESTGREVGTVSVSVGVETGRKLAALMGELVEVDIRAPRRDTTH